MILDNADDKEVFFDQERASISQTSETQRPTVQLIKYLPQTSQGCYILITSRNRDTAFRLTNNIQNLVDMRYMGKEDAVALLCKKLSHDHSSDAEKLELVELLEYLPLAITQAASYISVKRTRMTITRYSKLLRRMGIYYLMIWEICVGTQMFQARSFAPGTSLLNKSKERIAPP